LLGTQCNENESVFSARIIKEKDEKPKAKTMMAEELRKI